MQPKREEDFFWEGVDQGKLLVQRCCHCGAARHPPLPSCGQCLSLEWAGTELTGKGTVYSWLVSKHPNDLEDAGRIVVLVDMDEGVRIAANFAGETQPVVGERVAVAFVQVNGQTLPEFRRAEA